MKKIQPFVLLVALLSFLVQSLRAQDPAWLDTIAANNATLKTWSEDLRAQQYLNRISLRWADPEAEVEHSFGAPKGESSETAFSLTQSLDWGHLTGTKRKMTRSADKVAFQTYRRQRQDLLRDARRQLTFAVYYNRLCAELETRLQLALDVERLYGKRYAAGDINRLEWNKIRLNTSVVRTELDRARTLREENALDLQRLNGGNPLDCRDTIYYRTPLPPLAEFIVRVEPVHPVLGEARAAVSHAQTSLNVARTDALPSPRLGYTGTYSRSFRSNGITLGFTLPLWGSSRQKIRESRSRLAARQLELADTRQQLTAHIQQQYALALQLQSSADRLQRDLFATDNHPHLLRALHAGRLSLVDYLLELTFYYSARTALLEAERDARLAEAELWSLLV